jgi:Ca2+-binding RTX toxin-like protein
MTSWSSIPPSYRGRAPGLCVLTIDGARPLFVPVFIPPPPVIMGTSGPDTLVGGNDDGTIFGGAGDDLIDGRGGNDLLIGGSGRILFPH